MCWFMLLCFVHACVHGCMCSEFLPLCSCSNTYCAAIAVELSIGLCSTKVEQCMGVLEGLLRLTSFLLRAERDGMHRRRDQVSFFPVQMDQRTCFGFCIRFAFFHLWSPEKSYKNVAWHATFVFNVGFCHEHDYGQMCENLSCIEFLLYMYSGKIISSHQSQRMRMFFLGFFYFLSKITRIISNVSL